VSKPDYQKNRYGINILSDATCGVAARI